MNLNIKIYDREFAEDSYLSNSFDEYIIFAMQNTKSSLSLLNRVYVSYSRVLFKCVGEQCSSLHLIVNTQTTPTLFLASDEIISVITEYGFDFRTQTYSAITVQYQRDYATTYTKNLISLQDMPVGLTQAFSLVMNDERFIRFAKQNIEFDMSLTWHSVSCCGYVVNLYSSNAHSSFQFPIN